MGWNNIDLTTVNPNLEIIPKDKTFTWELAPGTKYDERDSGRIVASATIVNDGEFTGRRLSFSYPDPSKKDWSPRMLKRLEQALGVDASIGEDPVAYLNRAAGNRFMTDVRHTEPNDEYPNPMANLNIFNVRPSA